MIARALRMIERASLRNAKVTYTVATVLALLSGLALYRARIVTDVTEIVRTPSARTFKTCAEVFGLNQRAFLLVEADKQGREAHLLRFAKALEQKLASAPLVLS